MNEIELKRFKLAVMTSLSKEFALDPEVDISRHFLDDVLVIRVVQAVYGETLGTLNFNVPANWFEMLKKQHAPYWLRKRWPVKYKTHTWEARALYPKVSLPDEEHNRVWVRRYE